MGSSSNSTSGAVANAVVGRRPVWTAVRALLWVGLILIAVRFLVLPVRMGGGSMQPTYKGGSFHFVNRLAYKSKGPSLGDVVAVREANEGQEGVYLARVLAKPGQTVAVKEGALVLDGKPFTDRFTSGPITPDVEEYKLEKDTYLVAGDNRAESPLSKVQASALVGKVSF